jgi:hypothetical protein
MAMISFLKINNLRFPVIEGEPDPTELKDKIMSIKSQWDSDYYKTIAESLLQTTIEVMQHSKKEISLQSICYNMNSIDRLMSAARGNDELLKQLEIFEEIKKTDITGIVHHINNLANSALGKFLDPAGITLKNVVDSGGVIYFGLSALQYGV